MSKGVFELIAGAGEITVGALTGNPTLVMMGAATVAGGVGTLLTPQRKGIAANTLNPIQPWNVVYGQTRVGGTTIWQQTNGDTDKYWHRVIVLACHPCQSVDALIFDNKRVCLDTNGNSLSFGDSTAVIASQQTVGIASITRTNDLVTVVMDGPMPLPASTAAGPALMTGDTVQIQNVGGDQTLNGQFQIQVINDTTFTYVCGGNPISTSGGSVKTQWPDYGDTVHLEVALGTQSATNPPFPGLLATDGTGSYQPPVQGSPAVPSSWTSQHYCGGRTAVYLRMKYGGNTYQPGIPEVGFLVSGKNDIYDPRTGGNVYTTNSALCIADFLTNQTWGFKCAYGSDVPTAPLIAAANICDEQVALANGNTEARYTCNGSFQLSAKRGEILQNLLTSCGGRLTYSGGQYVINPAAWVGASVQMGTATPTNGNGSPIVSANMTIWVSWQPGSSGIGQPVIDVVYGSYEVTQIVQPGTPTNLTFRLDLGLGTISASAPQALTYSIPINLLSELTTMSVVASIQGTLYGSDVAPNLATLNIWDCYIDATFQDQSTQRIRPTATTVSSGLGYPGIFTSGVSGVVSNPQNAVDNDTTPPSTYATIQRTNYNGMFFAGYLALSGWPLLTSNNVTATSVNALEYAGGPFQWKPKVAVRDLYNGVKATYVCPANNWQASDMPPYAQDTDHGYAAPPGTSGYYDINMAADGGERRWLDMQFPFTSSTATAQRLAKIELLRRRQQGMGTFVFNLAMYQVTALDVIEMTLPFLGWTNKLLEVTAHRFTVQKHENENMMSLGTELDLQETDPSIYNWSTAEELNAEGFGQSSMVGTQSIAAPLTVTAANATVQGTNVTLGQIQMTWAAPTDGFVSNGGHVLTQYSTDGVNWNGLGTYDTGVTTAYIPNVSNGQQYWVRAAYVNVGGVQSPWTQYGPITASGASLNFADDETPAGALDGTNQTYTLQYAPVPPASLELFYNGDLLILNLDYTLSQNIITLTVFKPNTATGDFLRAWYRY